MATGGKWWRRGGFIVVRGGWQGERQEVGSSGWETRCAGGSEW